jgi:enolase-phosphatase E1
VVDVFKKWTGSGLKCHIYSSGSVEAQKLLFKYSEHGDLTAYLTRYFDTVNVGPKLKSESYKVIAKELMAEPEQILFLSDNPGEIRAAKKAGFHAIVLVRAGNAPLPEKLENDDEEPWLVVKEFGAVQDWLHAESLTMDTKVIQSGE